jgi:hypothetical protein
MENDFMKILRAIFLVCLLTASLAGLADAPAPFKVVKAEYGAEDQKTDVTKSVAARLVNGSLLIQADNETLGGDPAPGKTKQLEVTVEYNGKTAVFTAREGARLEISAEKIKDKLSSEK